MNVKNFGIMLAVLAAVMLLFGCTSPPGEFDGNAPGLGSDRDAHGCIASAGYSWCEVKQSCIRPWEESCCGECPQWMPPGPGFCKDGNIISGGTDSCGCTLPPKCENASTDGVGIANPASTNCIDNNGTLSIVDANGGQVGMCTLPGGKVCEEWAYFRGECSAQ